MPTKRLPSHANLDHLKSQARDFLTELAAGDPAAIQRLIEFHPRLSSTSNSDFGALNWSDALLVTAREYGYASWARLKRAVDAQQPGSQASLTERIEDPLLRVAVDAIDDGDIVALARLFDQDPALCARRARFEGENYFRNPALIAFIAENPVRNGALPPNIVEVAEVLLARGAGRVASDVAETLGLVASGRVARECGVQRDLIALLCRHGADPDIAMLPALAHGEFDAAAALLTHGAKWTPPAAACVGGAERFFEILPLSGAQDRHLVLALAVQLGKCEFVRALLESGEDPNRYNPVGAHSHATLLHQAAWNGDIAMIQLLLSHGSRRDARDTIWGATPQQWAEHAGQDAAAAYLSKQP